ncbi:DNA recombinase [Corynebacterium belfantii]|nr:DNA recombinase [Corynebacterium belfantii]MBG9266888.1 DNA recombinase [Corynebacterium belfantii]
MINILPCPAPAKQARRQPNPQQTQCSQCGAWYGRKTWASNTTYKYTVWQCNQKYGHDQPCRSATLRDEQIQDTYLKAITKIAVQLKTDGYLTQAIDTVFGTDSLEQKLGKLNEQIKQLEERLDAMIHENQKASQNQDDYLRRFTALEAKYQQALADKQQTLTEIKTINSRRATITAAYQQLADQPIQHFQPSQWTALIDHAVIGADEIRFIFRTGTEITVPIS